MTATEHEPLTPGSPDAPTWPAEFAARYRAAGYWRGETFGDFLRERATAHPDQTALVDPAPTRRTWTYRELDESADRLAAGFAARGITKGDRVVLQLPNIGEFIEVVFALFRIGALPVYALPAHRETEVEHFCAFTEAVAYVIPDRHAGYDYRQLATHVGKLTPSLREVFVVGDPGEHTALCDVPMDPAAPAEGPRSHELAFLQLSGGTTGVSKLIPRTHDDYLYSLWGSNEICGVDEDTRFLVVLPAAHNFPMSSPGWLGVLYAGGTVVLSPRPDPATAFPLIESERVTMTGMVPPLALVWTDAAPAAKEDLSSLELVLVGGAKYSEQAARRLEPALDCRLMQVFGMAEGLVNYTRLDDDVETIVSTQGRPISADDEVRVVDDADEDVAEGEFGHLLTRGPYTIRGYWRAPDHNARAFTEDGFYRTGDIVRRTPTGHLVVEGRAKDQINRGGEKIAPEEVENIILAHPAVHDVSVVAVPDPYLGERSLAHVILREGAGPLKSVEIKRFVRERGIAAYKVPDLVEFVDAFPHTGIGKISKKSQRSAAPARHHEERPVPMALPAIAPYALPTAEELPANRVAWTADPSRAVLLVHDLQNHFLKAFPAGEQPLTGMLDNTARVLEKCRELGVPVVHSAQRGGQTPEERGLQLDFWGPGVADDPAALSGPERTAPVEGESVITKWKYSAFVRTELEALLREQGRDQLIVVGVYAHIGVLMSAADAWQRDIQAFVVADAVADFSRDDHDMALRYAAGRCAVVTTADALFQEV